MGSKIIAVDFDGTLCENKWPKIGEANKEMITYLKDRQANGDKLILWTCRVDDMLKNAVDWSAEQGLIFDAVNENLPEIVASFGTDTRKIFANEYIDDRNAWLPSERIADFSMFILLKELRERHFEILWTYESIMDSIVIQMNKKAHQKWYKIVRRIDLDELFYRPSVPDMTEFLIVRILKEMVQKLEQDIIKGETDD